MSVLPDRSENAISSNDIAELTGLSKFTVYKCVKIGRKCGDVGTTTLHTRRGPMPRNVYWKIEKHAQN